MGNKAGRGEILSWCMFDFANSSYTTIIITAVYSAFFANQIAAGAGNRGDFLWGAALAVSYLAVVFTAPAAGALADRKAWKKKMLTVSWLSCSLFTGLLFFVKPGNEYAALILLVLSNIFFVYGENFISSFLPEISDEKNIGKISGYGWGLGYIGGIISLSACLYIIEALKSPDGFTVFSLRLTPVITSVFFIIFGLPAVLFLKERRGPSGSAREGGLITGSYARVFRTLKEIRHYKDLFVFLSAFFFYSAGTSVIISFAAIFAETTFGFGKGDLIFLIIIVNFVAAAGALIFGYVQDLTGCKRSLLITLGIWISAVLTIMFSDSENAFWGASFLVGIAMGSSQSVSRSLVGLFTPPDREAEFYGFWGLSGKLASAFGVFGFGAVSYITGNQKSALFVTAIFFAAGAVILFQVDEKRGRRAAKTGNDLNVSYL